MRRMTKVLLSLSLAASLVFTGMDASVLAASTVNAAEEAVAEERHTATEAYGAGETSDAAIANVEEAEAYSEEAAEVENNAVRTSEITEEDGVSDEALDYVNIKGATYMVAGEKSVNVYGYVDGEFREDQITDNYLIGSDGNKVAVRNYSSCYSDSYEQKTNVSAYFYLYSPIKAGTYNAYIVTKAGGEVKYSTLYVVDKPTVVRVSLPESGYDNYGDYIHVEVDGVKLGDGMNIKPTLQLNGKTVAEATEVLPDDGSMSGYIFKMKKDKEAAKWDESMEFDMGFADGVDNICKDKIGWYPDPDRSVPFEHVYYEVNKKKTEFQFKKGLNIAKDTAIKVTLKKYNNSNYQNETVATGEGKIDGNGLLAVALRSTDGKDFIPVAAKSYIPVSEYYSIDVVIGSEPAMEDRYAQIYRYDITTSSSSSSGSGKSYFGIITPTDYVYTTDTSFNPEFSIGDDRLKGSGDITAEIEGHKAILKKNGSVYTGSVELGSGLSEGTHVITVKKGETSVGSETVYSLEKGVFYENYQGEIGNNSSSKEFSVYIYSEDIQKEYYEERENKSIADKIWKDKGMKLQIFTPDGTEIDPGTCSYSFYGSSLTVSFTMPEKLNDYYGCYFKITSNGKTGRYFGSQGKSYYEYRREDRNSDIYSESLGQYYFKGSSGLTVCNYYGKYAERDGKLNCIQADSEEVSFPVEVTITRENETEPVKTLKLQKANFVTSNGRTLYYFFSSDDLKGLDLKEPYRVTAYDSRLCSYYGTGYLAVYTGKKPSSKTIKVTSVKINEASSEIAVGKSTDLTFSVEPSGASYTKVAWKSSNTKVATVDNEGKVTGVAPGTAKITVTVDGKSASADVTVIEKIVPLTGLEIEKESINLGSIYGSENIGIKRIPEDATEKVTCVSSDPSVASVNDEGVVTALKAGTATITVKGGGFEKTCSVTVKAALSGLKIDKPYVSINPGQKVILLAKAEPAGTSCDYEWNIAPDVNMSGCIDLTANGDSAEIKGLKPGKATVTVKATDKEADIIPLTASAEIVVEASDLGNDSALSGNEIAIAEAIQKEMKEDAGKQLWIAGLKEEYEYNGAAVEPEFEVYYGSYRLRLGRDYTVSFSKNKLASNTPSANGIITVKGKGGYSGSVTQEYRIVDKVSQGSVSIKKAKIDKLEKSYEYTGGAIVPGIEVSLDGKNLKKGTDYTVSVSKNTDAGTANLVVEGIGEYKDTVKKTFKITAVNLIDAKSAGKLKITANKALYRTGGATPVVSVVYNAGDTEWTLKEGVDYKLSCKNNKKTGTGKVYITGQGNFTKKTDAEFTIDKGDLAALELSAPDVTYKKDQKKATAYQSKVKIYDADGRVVLAKEYELTFTDLTAGGLVLDAKTTASDLAKVKENDRIMVTAAARDNGNFEGKLTGTYVLRTAKDIGGAKADTITGCRYDGSEKTPEVKLVFGGRKGVTLVKGTDYEVIGYRNNVEVGTATIVIAGIGDYSGIKNVTFKISAADVKESYIGRWNGDAFIK